MGQLNLGRNWDWSWSCNWSCSCSWSLSARMHASWRQFGYADKAFIGHIKRVKLLPSRHFRHPMLWCLCAVVYPSADRCWVLLCNFLLLSLVHWFWAQNQFTMTFSQKYICARQHCGQSEKNDCKLDKLCKGICHKPKRFASCHCPARYHKCYLQKQEHKTIKHFSVKLKVHSVRLNFYTKECSMKYSCRTEMSAWGHISR